VVGGKVVKFGVHGGAEWPGAAVDPAKGILYVPSNRIPWIIRAEYRDDKAYKKPGEKIPGDSLYQAKCAACHKETRAGARESEHSGDAYFPALTGITLLRSRDALISKSEFDENHRRVKLDQEITAGELEILFDYFSRLDKIADHERSFSIRAYWQLLLDDQGYPGSKPPWGLLSAIDLNTGRKIWQIPFGEYEKLRRAGAPVKGQLNFGGVIATAGGLVFATGTVDDKIRAFDSATGRELWSFRLPAAGSAPPLTYLLDGTQYVVVVASGGFFHGFSGRSDKLIAFKLPAARR
jgi:quinoprotein glucose dehydrogenase